MEQRGSPVVIKFLGKDPLGNKILEEYPGLYAGYYIYGREEAVVVVTAHGAFHVDCIDYDECTPWMTVEAARSMGYAVPDGPPPGLLDVVNIGHRQEGTPWMWSHGPDNLRIFFNDWSTRARELNMGSQLLGSYHANSREYEDEETGDPLPPGTIRRDLIGAVLVLGLEGKSESQIQLARLDRGLTVDASDAIREGIEFWQAELMRYDAGEQVIDLIEQRPLSREEILEVIKSLS